MKAYDLPITHNALKTRNDVAGSLRDILDPARACLVNGGSGLFIGNTSSTYSSRVALFEGWARLMWGVAPLYKGGFSWEGADDYLKGLSAGVDPESSVYWGDVGDRDQRMVEMAALALGFLLIPEVLWQPLDDTAKARALRWFLSINSHQMPDNNWRFFRVLVNVAFHNLGEPCDMEMAASDLDFLETLYVKDGWYRDAVPFDNYNPFAFHFYSLIYSVFMADEDAARSERFRERAVLFARQYLPFFLEDGSSIPYGRSLTYRFAVVSFFSACAFAGVEAVPWGVMKGIILRNLRWWFSQPIFDRDGLLTIGWAYPDLIMADRYNNPGSPYWALKAYLILALGEDHPFWKAEELPLPPVRGRVYLDCPVSIIQHTADDAVMLVSGQVPNVEMNHRAEKYLKFAYSAHYGFSVELGCHGFEETGCDSMLYLSDDDYLWHCRRDAEDKAGNEKMVRSSWHPMRGVDVTTWLIPYGNFHIRVHRIISDRELSTKEGGFGILHYHGHDLPVDAGIVNSGASASVSFPWGISFISDPLLEREAGIISPKPNLNIMADTTMVPVLSGKLLPGISWYVSIVGAAMDPSLLSDIPSVALDRTGGCAFLNGEEYRLI